MNTHKAVSQYIYRFKPGTLYDLSLWARTTGGTLNLAYEVYHALDPDGGRNLRIVHVTDVWTEYTWRFNATVGSATLYAGTHDGARLELDDFSIVEVGSAIQ